MKHMENPMSLYDLAKQNENNEPEQKDDETRQFTKAEIEEQEKFWEKRKAEIKATWDEIPSAPDLVELLFLIAKIEAHNLDIAKQSIPMIINKAVEEVNGRRELGDENPLEPLEKIPEIGGIRKRVRELLEAEIEK